MQDCQTDLALVGSPSAEWPGLKMLKGDSPSSCFDSFIDLERVCHQLAQMEVAEMTRVHSLSSWGNQITAICNSETYTLQVLPNTFL